jgi:hypothetical protein
MKIYQHQQLDNPESQIRILTLRRGTRNKPQSCSLGNVALANAPPYEALSYCWGSELNKPTVVLQQGSDSSPFPVTQNLFQALRRIRQPWADCQIWTDAICTYSHRTTMNYFESLRFVPQFSEGSNFTHLASQIWQYNRRIRTFAGSEGPPLGLGCSCPLYPSFVSAKPAAWKLRSAEW